MVAWWDEAVDEGGGDHRVAENLAPDLEAAVEVTMIEPARSVR